MFALAAGCLRMSNRLWNQTPESKPAHRTPWYMMLGASNCRLHRWCMISYGVLQVDYSQQGVPSQSSAKRLPPRIKLYSGRQFTDQLTHQLSTSSLIVFEIDIRVLCVAEMQFRL